MSTANKNDLYEIRKNVGMVFQNPDNQMVATIVEDDIAFGPENIGVSPKEIGERISFALHVTDMEKYRYHQGQKLSGGQKQRIAIAGALAIKPQILILDEATAMLDPKGRSEVLEVVKKLNEDGITVIAITHYMDEAVEADEVCVMGNGVIMAQGTPSEVFKQKEVLTACGLELPVSAKIAERLISAGLPLPEGILTKEDLSAKLCELLQKI